MDPRYPIGKFEAQPFSTEVKDRWLNDIKYLPTDLEMVVQNLDEYQLDTPYREGGWTVKQLVHHVADSHINAYTRFKLGLTEHTPSIKPYEEKKWALLKDVQTVPINISLTLLHALHQRWYAAIKDLTDDEWQFTVFHPSMNKNVTMWDLLGIYSWHGRHHTAHITTLKTKKKLVTIIMEDNLKWKR